MLSTRVLSVEPATDTMVVMLRADVASLADADILGDLQSVFDAMREHQTTNVVFDLSQNDFLASSLLEAVREVGQLVHGAGGRLALCNVSITGREILHVVRFDTLWPILPTRSDALTHVRA